jgi:hypothetical protein
MQIEVSKQSTEIVEVKTPSFYSEFDMIFYAITDHGVITVTNQSIVITPNKAESSRFQKEVSEVIKKPKCSGKEFHKAYIRATGNIEYHYKNFLYNKELLEQQSNEG